MKIQSIVLLVGLLGLVIATDPQRCAKQDDCPGGYLCTEVNKNLKECTRIDGNSKPGNDRRATNTQDTPGGGGDANGKPDDKPGKKPDGKHDNRNNTFTPIVGSKDIEFRRPIQELREKFPNVFNMYILALAELQSKPESYELSYYGIAGIHGAPFIGWQEPDRGVSRGYCTHNSVIFCTWHRPYLVLMEQQIIKTALTIAGGFGGDDAKKYTEAAKKIRLPYWDWSTEIAARIPDVVAAPQIKVIKPSGNETITNPLYSYHFTNDGFRIKYFSDFPQQRFRKTMRQPTGTPPVSREDLIGDTLQSTFQTRKDSTFQLFSIQGFSRFSTTRFPGGTLPSDWASVEGIHDEIHTIVGTNGGHMSTIPVSAFDPIFWLHHTQVDRLATIYQAIYPGSNVEPLSRTTETFRFPNESGVEDINTPLYPFKHEDSQYWTSKDVSTAESTHKYGYAYPEVPSHLEVDELKIYAAAAVKSLYGPNTNTSNFHETPSGALQRTEWLAHINFDGSQINGTFAIWLYIGGVPEGQLEKLTGEALVGGCASFSGGATLIKPRIITAGTVPLTQALANKGVKVSGPKADVVGYLKKHLEWRIMRGTEDVPTSALPTLEIGVSASDVKHFDDPSKLPEYGSWSTFYEVTEGKEGGLKPERGYLVASHDVVSANASKGDPTTKILRLRKRVYTA